MIDILRRVDRAWARAEEWLVVGVLILMVLVAGFAAGVRNLTRFDIAWASEMMMDLEWADSLLRKGTLWLAFLGASLATQRRKHINIDILHRIAPAKAKYVMLAIGTLVAAVISFSLTYAFWEATELNLTERPIEYELLGTDGEPMHVCDATQEQLDQLIDFDKPPVFCFFRAVLGAIGIPAETPGAAFQLIVPLMFFAMALRFLGQGIVFTGTVLGGEAAIEAAEAAERVEIRAQQQSLSSPSDDADPSDPGSDRS